MDSLKSLSDECVNLLHRNRLLQPLIKSELKSSLLSDVLIDKELAAKKINELKNKFKINSETDLDDFLIKNGLNNKQFNDLALFPLRSNQYSLDTFGNKAEARFLERKNQLDIIIYSLIRVSLSGLSRELYLKIYEKEEEFGEIASKYSEGIEKNTRGIVGPAPLEAAHPLLAEHLRTSKIGEVSQPIAVNNYFVITRVESYEPVQLDTYMKGKMCEELFELWLKQKSESILNELIKPHKSTSEPLGAI